MKMQWKNCHLKILYSVSQIFCGFFIVIDVHEDPRNNRSIESDLSPQIIGYSEKITIVWACNTKISSISEIATSLNL